jgi:hypothetical protein
MIDAHACTRVLLFAGLAFGAIQRDGTPVNGGKLRSLLGIDLQISARPTLELDGKSVHHSDSRRSSGYRWKTDQGCSEPIRRGRDGYVRDSHRVPNEPSEMPWSRVVTFTDPQPCVAAQAHRDRPSKSRDQNERGTAARRSAVRPFPETLVGQFSLLDEIVKLQPRGAQQRKLRSWGHDRDTRTPKL